MSIHEKEALQSGATQHASPVPLPHKGWFGQFLLRLHFYAGIFVGPFILIAALSGALYALAPQVEQVVYAKELHAPASTANLPLSDQVRAANAHIGTAQAPVAVRPAPEPGDTTRVMYAGENLGPSETRAIFVDPATGEVRGDLTAYGSSGALPLRTWIDQLHSNLHLGEPGRLYSELAASWLGVIALAGLGLWITRFARTGRKKDLLRPNTKAKGYRRLASWHGSLGLWVLVFSLFLSATGITWSIYGGANVSTLRTALSWKTPSVNTALSKLPEAAGGDHSHHQTQTAPSTGLASPADFDSVLAVAQDVNVNTGRVEIKPPASEDTAWVVQEIQRSYPTEVDAVSIDGQTLEVLDRVDFKDFNLASKLTRWGIDTHMGSMFGLPNQIVLFLVASSVAALVVLGYRMWWKRRPTKNPTQRMGNPPARGSLRRAPWWGTTLVLVVALGLGLFLPLMGISLAAFVIVDLIRARTAHRKRSQLVTTESTK